MSYPFNRYWRVEGLLGYNDRKYNGYPFWVETDEGSGIIGIPTQNSYPTIGSRLVGDTTQYESFGPISGRKVSIDLSWSPYVSGTKLPGQNGTTLTWDVTMDLRHYFKITQRSLFAIRLYGFRADGDLPDVLAFGGIDTLRTFPIYGIVGNTAGFLNVEFRFPLIDLLATPFLGIREIRGKVFIDVGGAKLQNQPWQFWNDYVLCGNGTLIGGAPEGCNGSQGGYSDWGFGFQTNFLGLPLHFDIARQWNFKNQLTNFKLFFYLGQEF